MKSSKEKGGVGVDEGEQFASRWRNVKTLLRHGPAASLRMALRGREGGREGGGGGRPTVFTRALGNAPDGVRTCSICLYRASPVCSRRVERRAERAREGEESATG